ncbi:hypothetical protein D9B85_00275 [Corynebacterium diphtheriae]|nr:hypothetical protein D9B85_00275 [Corynebacterium diphtheriae]
MPVISPARSKRLLDHAKTVGRGHFFPSPSGGRPYNSSVANVFRYLRERGFPSTTVEALRARWLVDLANSPLPAAMVFQLAGNSHYWSLATHHGHLMSMEPKGVAELMLRAKGDGMISMLEHGFVIKADVWSRAQEVIRRGYAAEYIEQINAQYRGAGGRKATAVVPSIEAVLTAGLALIMIGKPASIAGIHRLLCELEPDQRLECGFAKDGALLAYPAFANWLTRQLEVFDPGADLVARRVLNHVHREQLAARTAEQREASELARARRDELVNLIVAAVDDRCPGGYAGDVVADETIIDLAGPSEGLGVRPDKQRAAAYAGAYYIRDKTHQLGTGEKMREVTKRGFGIGVTAVSRVGSADDLYSVSPVITAISIDKPSPGSTVALGRALQMHQANGFAASVKTKANARLPYLCVDMGYSVRPDFTTVVHDHGFAPVMRYPVSRQTVWRVRNRSLVLSRPVLYRSTVPSTVRRLCR